jgi:hypothetical protein
MTGRQVGAACEEAEAAGEVRLALLLAQAGENCEVAADVKKQMRVWREERRGAPAAGSRAATTWELLGRQKGCQQLYMLLAGDLDFEEELKPQSRDASHMRRTAARALLGRQVRWLRALALQLWYGVPKVEEKIAFVPNTSVEQVLRDFKKAVDQGRIPGTDSTPTLSRMKAPCFLPRRYAALTLSSARVFIRWMRSPAHAFVSKRLSVRNSRMTSLCVSCFILAAPVAPYGRVTDRVPVKHNDVRYELLNVFADSKVWDRFSCRCLVAECACALI